MSNDHCMTLHRQTYHQHDIWDLEWGRVIGWCFLVFCSSPIGNMSFFSAFIKYLCRSYLPTFDVVSFVSILLDGSSHFGMIVTMLYIQKSPRSWFSPHGYDMAGLSVSSNGVAGFMVCRRLTFYWLVIVDVNVSTIPWYCLPDAQLYIHSCYCWYVQWVHAQHFDPFKHDTIHTHRYTHIIIFMVDSGGLIVWLYSTIYERILT